MDNRSMYFTASGLAHIQGLDHFLEAVPFDRFSKLHRAYLETKGMKWVSIHFIKTILAIAGRYHRKNHLFPPNCIANCKYRITPPSPERQSNALRIEIMSFTPRCGWNLKDGRIGGCFDDYYPCTFIKEAHP